MSDSFWEATYRQNIARMIGVCCRYTQNRQTAEDLAHDAFLIAIDKVSSFEKKGPFEAWLRRIVVNVALQYLREQKRQEKWEQDHAYLNIGHEIEEERPDSDHSVFSEAELLEIIGCLPEHHRLVFNLYVIDDFTHAQIAARLGISEGTSKSHLARARKKVRELMGEKLGKSRKRKRAFIWFMVWHPVHTMDYLVSARLKNLAIPPQKLLAPDIAHAPAFDFRPSGISHATYWKTGLMTISTALFLAAGANLPDRPDTETLTSATYPATDLAPLPGHLLFSNPKSATISENHVIVEKTKNSETMKTLSTLGGLMAASLTLDTANLSTLLPNAFKSEPLAISRTPEPPAIPEGIKLVTKSGSEAVSGSFFASKLFWSAESDELYFLGDRVKVDVRGNKFTGAGKFSFLNKVYYLVVDGVPVKPNETVKLQEKKYNLTTLSKSEGAGKYGENGKSGVVEISQAE